MMTLEVDFFVATGGVCSTALRHTTLDVHQHLPTASGSPLPLVEYSGMQYTCIMDYQEGHESMCMWHSTSQPGDLVSNLGHPKIFTTLCLVKGRCQLFETIRRQAKFFWRGCIASNPVAGFDSQHF